MVEPELWFEEAPRRWDLAVPWWVKVLAVALACVAAVVWVDRPVAVWAKGHPIPDLGYRAAARPATAEAGATTAAAVPVPKGGDVGRELMFLEQFGQLVCSVVVILAVAVLDRAGRRRALAMAVACLLTLGVTHLTKDVCGRSRPFVAGADGGWLWRGPWQTSSAWGSFPSAHTTAAFALAASLAWFYPRGRMLFMTLALITAGQRVLHTAHYVSDVIAGMGIGVFVVRASLRAKLAGRVMALGPASLRAWWMG
jgi:membrane-associated phospholipid phosphatase